VRRRELKSAAVVAPRTARLPATREQVLLHGPECPVVHETLLAEKPEVCLTYLRAWRCSLLVHFLSAHCSLIDSGLSSGCQRALPLKRSRARVLTLGCLGVCRAVESCCLLSSHRALSLVQQGSCDRPCRNRSPARQVAAAVLSAPATTRSCLAQLLYWLAASRSTCGSQS